MKELLEYRRNTARWPIDLPVRSQSNLWRPPRLGGGSGASGEWHVLLVTYVNQARLKAVASSRSRILEAHPKAQKWWTLHLATEEEWKTPGPIDANEGVARGDVVRVEVALSRADWHNCVPLLQFGKGVHENQILVPESQLQLLSTHRYEDGTVFVRADLKLGLRKIRRQAAVSAWRPLDRLELSADAQIIRAVPGSWGPLVFQQGNISFPTASVPRPTQPLSSAPQTWSTISQNGARVKPRATGPIFLGALGAGHADADRREWHGFR